MLNLSLRSLYKHFKPSYEFERIKSFQNFTFRSMLTIIIELKLSNSLYKIRNTSEVHSKNKTFPNAEQSSCKLILFGYSRYNRN